MLTPPSPEETKRSPNHVQRVTWVSLSESDADAIRTLYEGAFPASERRILAEVVATAQWLWVSKTGDTVTGFATASALSSVNSALLQYLAVAPRFQSAGIGSLLLAYIERDLRCAEKPLDGIYVEIEPPSGPDEGSQSKRRFEFYLRWGAEPVVCIPEYFIADFSSVPPGRLPMLLLWRPLNVADQPRADRLRDALSDIYRSEYSRYADPDFLADILDRVRC
jgi:GNAT superfamily N-acetyltransferase